MTGPEVVTDGGLYAARQKIYPREIAGRFQRLRTIAAWVLLGLFYLIPWVPWGDRQAVLFDLPARQFHIFALTLWPQDFYFLTWLLVIAALALFFFTALAGRVFCGYACPQTVWTEVFLWMERFVEGSRSQQMKLAQAPWTPDKLLRQGAKQFLWITFALWTGFTFVGYFTPITELAGKIATLATGPWETFWVLFYGAATYVNAGYMREQVCKYMCPYARFQGAMFDRDTLIITYDGQRGEPRGARGRSVDHKAKGLGDCVDCTLCVQVCPTGIDIRKGLQYECIGCGACADVCDTVMDKMGYARGLVRYTTQNAMANHWTRAQTWRHVLRPRVLLYSSILLSIVIAMVVSMSLRTPFKVNVVRDRGVMARIVSGGKIENVYQLQVMNATESTQRYRITAQGLPGLAVASEDVVTVDSTQATRLAVRVQAPYDAAEPGTHPIKFEIQSLDTPGHLSEKSMFMVPR